jgi:hypothetical protein
MKKVEVINNKTGQRYGAKWDDDIKMQAWIDEQVKAESWGRGERIYNEKQSIEAGLDIANAVEIIVRQEPDQDGIDQPINYYRFDPEFVITITDITAEEDAKKAIELEKANLRATLPARAGSAVTLQDMRAIINNLVKVLL